MEIDFTLDTDLDTGDDDIEEVPVERFQLIRATGIGGVMKALNELNEFARVIHIEKVRGVYNVIVDNAAQLTVGLESFDDSNQNVKAVFLPMFNVKIA